MIEIAKADTKEDKAVLNQRAKEAGFLQCPRCGDSILVTPFHELIYREGYGEKSIEVPHERPRSHGVAPRGYVTPVPKRVHGHLAVKVLCEPCWGECSVEERWAHHEKMLNDKKDKIPSVIPFTENGVCKDHPQDLERFQKAYAAVLQEIEEVKQAIMAGK